MTAAYLDPFAHIVDLKKPSGDFLFLVTEIHVTFDTTPNAGSRSVYAASAPFYQVYEHDTPGETTLWKCDYSLITGTMYGASDPSRLPHYVLKLTDLDAGTTYWTWYTPWNVNPPGYGTYASLNDLIQDLCPGATNLGVISSSNIIQRSYSVQIGPTEFVNQGFEMVMTNCAAHPFLLGKQAGGSPDWFEIDGATIAAGPYNIFDNYARWSLNNRTSVNTTFRDKFLSNDLNPSTITKAKFQEISLALISVNIWSPQNSLGPPYAAGSYVSLNVSVPNYTGIPAALALRSTNTPFATSEIYNY